MLNLVQNYGIFTKLLFCRNYCQNKKKKETKDVEKTKAEGDSVATSQLMSRHNRREMTTDMLRQLNLCHNNN